MTEWGVGDGNGPNGTRYLSRLLFNPGHDAIQDNEVACRFAQSWPNPHLSQLSVRDETETR